MLDLTLEELQAVDAALTRRLLVMIPATFQEDEALWSASEKIRAEWKRRLGQKKDAA